MSARQERLKAEAAALFEAIKGLDPGAARVEVRRGSRRERAEGGEYVARVLGPSRCWQDWGATRAKAVAATHESLVAEARKLHERLAALLGNATRIERSR